MNDNNQLITINQNAKLSLIKSRNFLDITRKILEKKDDDWIQRLWKWADENDIPDIFINFTMDNVVEDLYKMILFKINSDINYDSLDLMAQARIESAISDNITNIINPVAFIISLPFLLFDLNKNPYHFELEFSFKIIKNILESNKKMYKTHYGIHRKKNLLLETENLDLSYQGRLLTEDIFKLKKLKKINLTYNRFSKVEIINDDYGVIKGIQNFKNLEELHIKKINLRTLPCIFKNAKRLKVFHFENNRYLISLPEEVEYLTNLESLSLRNNPKLVLSNKQINWIKLLKKNGCNVIYDHDLFERRK